MITFSRIKRILQSCAFKPSDDGPLKIIADVGDPKYYRQRVCEMLKQIDEKCTDDSPGDVMKTAMSLLALAVAEIELSEMLKQICDVPVERDVN